MDKRELHDENYKKAVELNKQGRIKEAAAYARTAIQLAKEMYDMAGMAYTKSQAEYLLEMIEDS
ncbi:MAG: hypothetical protein A2X59_01930 [Nitrospirae bacterium GWC2_42_7]|nr:MAG: hypothetical protein A2X59_01930 [Nitrospirae bacterium GWC2_42_7]HBO85253.1 hypothetical protein [Deltaproteobacteria bacterium]